MTIKFLREKYQLPNIESLLLVFVDGIYQEQISDQDLLHDQIIFKLLPKTAKEVNELLQQLKIMPCPISSDGKSGIFLYLPHDAKIPAIIHLLFLYTKQCNAISTPINNIVVTGENSSITIFEEYDSNIENISTQYLQNIATNYILKDNSTLNLHRVLKNNDHLHYQSNLTIDQWQNSKSEINLVTSGGQKIEETLSIHLNAKQASCEINSLYMLKHQQHCNYNLHIDHLFPNCFSQATCKTVVSNEACANLQGRIVISQNAQQSTAKYTNKNLLLSDNAQVTTSPELEIYANDVKCSHGATIGQISQEMLWYLQSRGIEKTSARNMLIEAFIKDITDKLPTHL